MGSRLNREPMVVQEPEARLSDAQVSVVISLKSGPKTWSRVRSEAWAGPVHALCLGKGKDFDFILRVPGSLWED